MMLEPPTNSGDFAPGEHFPCPECCSVWWISVCVLGLDKEVTGYIDKMRCVNCEYELNLEESEV